MAALGEEEEEVFPASGEPRNAAAPHRRCSSFQGSF